MDTMLGAARDIGLPVLVLASVILFIVQLKIVRTLNAHTNLIMFYGKQIEEIKKGISAVQSARPRRLTAPGDEHGLYEVLND